MPYDPFFEAECPKTRLLNRMSDTQRYANAYKDRFLEFLNDGWYADDPLVEQILNAFAEWLEEYHNEEFEAWRKS